VRLAAVEALAVLFDKNQVVVIPGHLHSLLTAVIKVAGT
jgi:hypothetical protein